MALFLVLAAVYSALGVAVNVFVRERHQLYLQYIPMPSFAFMARPYFWCFSALALFAVGAYFSRSYRPLRGHAFVRDQLLDARIGAAFGAGAATLGLIAAGTAQLFSNGKNHVVLALVMVGAAFACSALLTGFASGRSGANEAFTVSTGLVSVFVGLSVLTVGPLWVLLCVVCGPVAAATTTFMIWVHRHVAYAHHESEQNRMERGVSEHE